MEYKLVNKKEENRRLRIVRNWTTDCFGSVTFFDGLTVGSVIFCFFFLGPGSEEGRARINFLCSILPFLAR